jgi:tetratricopeptide (TPR) repeat protein
LKRLSVIVFLFFSLAVVGNNAGKAGPDSLDYYLSMQSYFNQQKEMRIGQITTKIEQNTTDYALLYSLYGDLFEEYRSYIYDSAYVCVEKLLDVSYALNDPDKITSSTAKMGFCYLSSGMFKEAFDILMAIQVAGCSDATKIDYYTYKARLYYDLADYNNRADFRSRYNEKGNQIIDSAIVLFPNESSRYWATVALKRMKSDNDRGALEAFQKMLNTQDYSEHDLAIATSSTAYLYSLQGKKAEAKHYFTLAAIADIKSSTKETVALRELAQLMYEEGDVTHAVNYVRQALADASFYNARHRQLEIGYILPIIEEERTNLIEKQKDRISRVLLFGFILLILLILALFIIWKQLKRLNQAKQTIQKTNENLVELNNNLMEANKIKEEYIGYFFSQSSEFIDKIEALQKWVKKKLLARQYEDLNMIHKNPDAQQEREALYIRFDQIFLKLFPDFVNEFNQLLKSDEQIQLKKGELLNTDLRIYALMRLGIRDNEQIAQFLGYSVNTIYTYKTKIKNKAKTSNEEFKEKIMEIKSI